MAKKIVELRQIVADLQAKGDALLMTAEQEDRDLTDAEESEFDEIKAALKKNQAEISRLEAATDRRQSLGVIRGVPAGDMMTDEPNPATTGGFRNVAEFAQAVHAACRRGNPTVDARLLSGGVMGAPTNFHTGGAASGEGYEVPVDFREQIFEIVTGMDDIASLIDEEPTNAREVRGLADETTPWGATGVSANWRAEASQMTPSKLATDPRSMPLHELYAFVVATEELLEDAPRLASRITRRAGEAISWKRNDAIIYGTGAGQPLGWFNSPALISVAKEAAQPADTIVAANVLKMFSRLLIVPSDSPFWLTNTDTLPQLATMTIGDQPIWTPPATGLQNAPGGFLLGRPIRFSEHAKTLGDKGDLQFVSPKGYYGARRTSGPQFAQSAHLYFDFAMEAFRWTFRFGGQPHLSAPVAPANGSNTKSHFVTLDERA